MIAWTYRPPKLDAGVKLAAVREEAVHAGAEVLLEASRPLVPVDTGALQLSGEVLGIGPGVAAVRYYARSKDGFVYAIKIHEDYTLNHPHGGQAGYLGHPMVTDGPAVLAAMAAVVRAGLRP